MKGIETAMGMRLTAALAAVLLVSSAAHAGVAEELTAAIKKCAAIADDGMRHACYDQLPTLLKAPAPGANAEPAAAQPNASPSGEASDSWPVTFGSDPVPADHITATVESFTYDNGVFVVTLDNGQVWRQVAAIGGQVHFSRDKKDHVAIWRSAFGYDVLRIEGHHTTYHVKRIK
jgi:hypothetical protein